MGTIPGASLVCPHDFTNQVTRFYISSSPSLSDTIRTCSLFLCSPSAIRGQLDLDCSFTTDKLEVQLSAALHGKVTNALDWIGAVAGALAQADNTTLAIKIHQIHVSVRVRLAVLPNADIMLIGEGGECRCRIDPRRAMPVLQALANFVFTSRCLSSLSLLCAQG